MKSNPLSAGARLPVQGKKPRRFPTARLRYLSVAAIAGCLLAGFPARAQQTWPVNGVAGPREACYAFTHATIVKDAQSTLKDATLVIRDGKITAVGAGAAIPKDAVVIDCKGKFIYPSFVDIYSDYGMPAIPPRTGGRGGTPQMLSKTRRLPCSLLQHSHCYGRGQGEQITLK